MLKLQGWGVVLVTFFVLWFPVMWLMEPNTNLKQEQALEPTRSHEDSWLRSRSPKTTASVSGACGATATSSRAA